MKRESTSLNQFISKSGLCSRREADELISSGVVTINGKTARCGNRVFPGDHVKVKGKLIHRHEKKVYLLLNKPKGIICTTDSREPRNIVDFVGYKKRIYPVGRLDKDSQGLIILTNDGDIVNAILRSRYGHEKEYLVKVNRKLEGDFKRKMENGIPILGQMTKKCHVEILGDRLFKIILTQGLNRQIRRMCEYLDYEVRFLKRLRIMNLQLDNLETGKWRAMTGKELSELKGLLHYEEK